MSRTGPFRAALMGLIALVGASEANAQGAGSVPTGVTTVGAPQPPPSRRSDEELARFFDDYIARTMRSLDVPGGALIVVREGRPIFAKGYGHADVAAKRPVDVERSLFRAASVSKISTLR